MKISNALNLHRTSMSSWLRGSKVLGVSFSIIALAACGGTTTGGEEEPNEIAVDTQVVAVERSISESNLSTSNALKSTFDSSTSIAPNEMTSPYDFNPGAKLIFRDSIDVDAESESLLDAYFGSTEYDVKDLNTAPDGSRLVFAAHGPLDHPTDNTWNVYQLDFVSGQVSRIIVDDEVANAGQDTSPTFANDGTVVFSSDRSAGSESNEIDRFILANANCYKVAPSERPSLLHSMTDLGENITQLTYGLTHDLKTTTLKNGKVAFVRESKSYTEVPFCSSVTKSASSIFDFSKSDGLDRPLAMDDMSQCDFAIDSPLGPVLVGNDYTILEISVDGAELNQLYETVSVSASEESFLRLDKITQAENGRILGVLRNQLNGAMGGNILEFQSPTEINEDVVFAELSPKALVADDVNLYPGQASVGGWFSSVASYNDTSDRIIVSSSNCLIEEGGVTRFCSESDSGENISSQYAIWVIDNETNSRLPIVSARLNRVFSDIAVSQPHSGAPYPYEPVRRNIMDGVDQSTLICGPVTPGQGDGGTDGSTTGGSTTGGTDGSTTGGSNTGGTDGSTTGGTDGSTTGGSNTGGTDGSTTGGTDGSTTGGSNTGGTDGSTTGGSNTGGTDGSTTGGTDGSTGGTDGSTTGGTDGSTGGTDGSTTGGTDGSTGGTDGSTTGGTDGSTGGTDGSTTGGTDGGPVENSIPVANAGDDQLTVPGQTVELSGAGSSDADGGTLTYSWEIVSQPQGSDVNLSSMDSVVVTLVPTTLGTYSVGLIVSDGIDSSVIDIVNVTSDNARPVANAGPDQSLPVMSTALLDGSESADLEGYELTYRWTLVSQPATSSASLTDPSSSMPMLDIDVIGTYVAQLIVNDGFEDSKADTVTITTQNVAPVAKAGDDATVKANASVTLDGSESYDADGDAIGYSWTLTSAPQGSEVSLNRAARVNPNFTPDVVGTYVAQLIVNDGELNSIADTVTITATEEPIVCDLSEDTSRLVPVTLRDFKQSHPDFEYKIGFEENITSSQLGADGLPVYSRNSGSSATTTGKDNFNQWYRDVAGVNIPFERSLTLTRDEGSNVWEYSNKDFFPLDGEGWGNTRGQDHNFYFTLEMHLQFDYNGGEVFTFTGDDDLWVYINGKRVIDIGGVHGALSRTISLDALARSLDIVKGESYTFDLFFAERHTTQSQFQFQTSINLTCLDDKKPVAEPVSKVNNKVKICHHASDNKAFVISTSVNALNAHVENHGDCIASDDLEKGDSCSCP